MGAFELPATVGTEVGTMEGVAVVGSVVVGEEVVGLEVKGAAEGVGVGISLGVSVVGKIVEVVEGENVLGDAVEGDFVLSAIVVGETVVGTFVEGDFVLGAIVVGETVVAVVVEFVAEKANCNSTIAKNAVLRVREYLCATKLKNTDRA